MAKSQDIRAAGGPEATSTISSEVWLMISDLVLDNERRRAVSDSLGISFSRARALRRLARGPLSMGDLADALGIDPPNATVVVDELESMKLARRKPHPTDRRAKLVETTPKGRELARRADEILATPPPALSELDQTDLESLRRMLKRVTASQRRV